MRWLVPAVLEPAGENVSVRRELPFELTLVCETDDPSVIGLIEAAAPDHGLVLERLDGEPLRAV